MINNALNPVLVGSLAPEPMASANPLQILIPAATNLWILGITAMLIYTAVSYFKVKSRIGTAVLLQDNVYQSERVTSPFVLGIIKPKIYLPFNLSEQDSSHVIAHEKAHIRRCDHLWKPFGFLLLTLHWFNPLMWVAYAILCRDIELACDEKVISNLDSEQKADYSQALLACSVSRRTIAACPLAFGEVAVKRRIKSVLNYKKPAFWVIVIAVVLSIGAAVCFLTDPATTTLGNIEGLELEESILDTTRVWMAREDGESYNIIGSVPRDLLRDLADVRISKRAVSNNKDDRKGAYSLVLQTPQTEFSPTSSAMFGIDRLNEIKFPEPIYTTAIKAVDSADDEKLGMVLNEYASNDCSLKVEIARELKQTIISAMGEYHVNTLKWYLDNVYKIPVELFAPKIPYRETITKSAEASYRHKKQSGGAGQFGEVFMMIEPYYEDMPQQKKYPIRNTETVDLPWGGKLVFNTCIVGGAIDARFMPAILKGIMEKMEEGPLTGSYARDIVVNVFDGKMHPVDSNEMAFKLAGRNAFKEAFKNAGPKILEPIYDMEVTVPSELMGGVMTDLQSRRAIVMGMDSEGMNTIIKAKVPLAEMYRYSTALSSITSGRAVFSMQFAEYEAVPTDVQSKLLKTYEELMKDED
jgi:hypothetical protein